MATETKVETKQVEKEIKVCDYCRLISEEDIDDDEEFSEMLLNPVVDVTDPDYYVNDETMKTIRNIETKDELREFIDTTFEWFEKRFTSLYTENTADLCPQCTDQLFGDEEPTGIRAGTGFLQE